MKIKNLTFKNLSIPFKTTFQHASATRLETETVIAIAESDAGHTGYGEGCPRSYVTGETRESCFLFFKENKTELKQLCDFHQLQQWVARNRSTVDSNPAAWCSIEMALIDLMAKENGTSIEELLSLPEISGSFEYTAVLGMNSLSAFKKQLLQYQAIGFQHYKLKISGKPEEDQEKIEFLKSSLRDSSRIRLDANNAWSQPEDCIRYLENLDCPVFAIEEPIAQNDFQGHRAVFEKLKLPIILDESFNQLSQFQEIKEAPEHFIINIRVSKMGGILRSLEIIKEARHLDIPVIVGAQVGETSLLTRAALTLCNAFRGTIIAQEGAFGTHLLAHDITNSPLMFGAAGKLDGSKLEQKSGFGIHVDTSILNTSTSP